MNAWLFNQQCRFVRPDGARYLRPDISRYLAPDRKWEGQPRVDAGSPDGGQFTYGVMGGDDESSSGRPRVYITGDEGEGLDTGLDEEDGDPGDSFIERFFFGSLGGGGIGHNGGPPLEEPPKIPKTKPLASASSLLRSVATWIGRALSLRAMGAIAGFLLVVETVQWVRARWPAVMSYLDPPKTMEELEAAVTVPRTGTELHHHKMEQEVSRRRGMTQREIDAPGNRVRIPTLKHYEITGWYRTPSRRFGGLSPRQYLADKPPDEHARVGREALLLFEVLKP